jgi:hypothetical protein
MERVAACFQERAAQVLLTFVTDGATFSVSTAIGLAIAFLESTDADGLLTVRAPETNARLILENIVTLI